MFVKSNLIARSIEPISKRFTTGVHDGEFYEFVGDSQVSVCQEILNNYVLMS